MQPAAYVDFFAEQVAEAIVTARILARPVRPAGTRPRRCRSEPPHGLHRWYGSNVRRNFASRFSYDRRLPKITTVECLFFWDADNKLIATTLNLPAPLRKWKVAPPSTQTSGIRCVNRSARLMVKICTSCLDRAAGDQSPHLISVKKPKNACGTCEVSSP